MVRIQSANITLHSYQSNNITFFDGVMQCKPLFFASSTMKFSSFAVNDEGNIISFCFSSSWNNLMVEWEKTLTLV